MDKLYKITGIFQIDNPTIPLKSHQYRVNRIGTLRFLARNSPMWLDYQDNKGTLMTSKVLEFEDDDGELVVTTGSAIYHLESIV